MTLDEAKAIVSAHAEHCVAHPSHQTDFGLAAEVLLAEIEHRERYWAQFDHFPKAAPELETATGPGTNSGHGHVWERPDGMRARCGGPGMCSECSRDQARLNRSPVR